MQKEVELSPSHLRPQFKVGILSIVRKVFLKHLEICFPHPHCQALIPRDVGAT